MMVNFGMYLSSWLLIYYEKKFLSLNYIKRMSYEDWLRNFDNCQICNLTPESIIEDLSESDWQNSRVISVLF